MFVMLSRGLSRCHDVCLAATMFVSLPRCLSRCHKDSINSLERRDQVIIFRLRAHHAPVNAHLNRIQPMTFPVCHFCDAPYETTTHLLFQCTSLQDLREEYLPPRPDAWNTLYSNSQQLKKTSTFYSQMSSRRAKVQTTAGSDE
ncbi:hypothetical protein ElyMa_001757600 [Elysia marginata]|uniref:Reverse transcriptase zinc-binding domain-containing protein n=1 Tax=Elysia marginata TaxID=1093978 RepID=A0AAV4EBF8_9GAST|nr:hypothetical protein ElyMa_001757600 [Elysia marginata]